MAWITNIAVRSSGTSQHKKGHDSGVCIVFGFLFSLILVGGLPGQMVTSTLRGLITDGSGGVLPGVDITVINLEMNATRSTVTGGDGYYTLDLLPAGSYRLEAEVAGFKKFVRSSIRLRVSESSRVDVSLEVGPVIEVVTVTTKFRMLQVESPALGEVIENWEIGGLPLNGRNFIELSLLVPGAYPHAPGSPGSLRRNFSVNVNGAREEANNFLLDGVYNTDPVLNSFALSPPVDAIQEFKLLTGIYEAAFGRSAGAQVNVILKSGTSRFHGTVYEFVRNAALDARNFFDDPAVKIPQLQQNQFGFSLGGPVRQDRVFFFADYEGRRRRQGITRTGSVPTSAERQGTFRKASCHRPSIPFTGAPFPNATIPSDRLHPSGVAVANLYPIPNLPVPGQNFISAPQLKDGEDRFDARIDNVLSSRDRVVARYSFNDRDLAEPFAGRFFSSVPGYGITISRRGQNMMLAETHVFGPHWINDVRLAYNRVAGSTLHENRGNDINQQVGIPSLAENPRDFGLSFITVAGFSPWEMNQITRSAA